MTTCRHLGLTYSNHTALLGVVLGVAVAVPDEVVIAMLKLKAVAQHLRVFAVEVVRVKAVKAILSAHVAAVRATLLATIAKIVACARRRGAKNPKDTGTLYITICYRST